MHYLLWHIEGSDPEFSVMPGTQWKGVVGRWHVTPSDPMYFSGCTSPYFKDRELGPTRGSVIGHGHSLGRTSPQRLRATSVVSTTVHFVSTRKDSSGQVQRLTIKFGDSKLHGRKRRSIDGLSIFTSLISDLKRNKS